MVHQATLRLAAAAAWLAGSAALLHAYPFGPGPGFAGAPGDQTCAACHGGGRTNTGGGGVQLNFNSYAPGQLQHVILTITDATAQRWGFEATARAAADNSQAGTLATTDGNTQLVSASGLQYTEHTLAGTRPGTTGSITFQFDWTPPASSVGDVIIYVAANAANGNNQADSGDHIYTAQFRINPQSSSQSGPSLGQGTPVVNGASFQPGMAPGVWMSVFGTNLAPNSRDWRSDEIVNGVLPTSLDGVEVEVDNKPAAVSFIGPGQINFQAPDDAARGTVTVKVKTPQGTASTTVILSDYAPAFFMYGPANRKYIAAQHADFSPVGPPGLFPTSAPAQPGEVIILYATGLGPTNPPVPAGQLVSQAAQLQDPSKLTIRIGGAVAEVQFAGVTMAGLYQINVKVPDNTPDGDAEVEADIAGNQAPRGSFISVQKATP